MSSVQLISDGNSGTYVNTNLKNSGDQKISEEESEIIPLINNQSSVILDRKSENLPYGIKKEIAETDDSFEIFVPLKVKNSKYGFKNSNYVSSPKKLKKKKTISTNRLCPYFSSKKSTSSKEDKDLQIALARSLADVSPGKSSENVTTTVINERKSPKKNYDFLKTLTSKIKKPGAKSILFRRTAEERQSILTKKVAIVLIGKENINDESFQKHNIELISSILEGAWDKNSTLWEHSKTKLDNLADFYVNTLAKFVEQSSVISTMSETKTGFKEDDDDEASSGIMDIKTENESDQLEEKYDSSSDEDKREFDKELNHFGTGDFSECNIINKNKLINDSLNVLSDDFFMMFGGSELSDIKVILKTTEILPCHQFVLHVRCPSVLVYSEHSKLSNTLDFTQYSAKATLAFFKYLYSGKIEFIYDLPSEDKSDLYVLAKKFNVEFLEKFMLTAFRSDSFHLYSQSTCSPPNSASRDSPDSSQGPKEIVSNECVEWPSPSLNLEKELKLSNEKKLQREKPSCSVLYSSPYKNNTERNFAIFTTDNSSYDIFKDEIKSPCNSSVLCQNISQTKRKLDYSCIKDVSKKFCSENIPDNLKNSPEIVTLDSDSDDGHIVIENSSASSTSNVQQTAFDGLSVKQTFHENSSNSFDFSNSECDAAAEIGDNVDNEVFKMGSHQITVPFSTVTHSPIKSSSLLMTATSHNQEKSFDKYFETSFPDVNENVDKIESSSEPNMVGTPPILRNPSRNVLTPLQEIIIDDATPKPDYGAMISPELKAELRKYGIKPDLDQRKARALLRYVYEQIHPIRSELPRYTSPVPSTSKERTPSPVIIIDDSDQSDLTDTAGMNSETDFAYEEYLFNQSKEWNEISLNENGSDLRKTVIKFIKSDNELFSNVVLFRPLLLKKFYKTFKEHGVHCSLFELMDVLDDLCVNYHVEKTDNRQKRRHKRKPVMRKKQKET